jgi:hypothetical protein
VQFKILLENEIDVSCKNFIPAKQKTVSSRYLTIVNLFYKSIKTKNMKNLFILFSAILLTSKLNAQNPTMVIGGIEVKGFTYDEDILRSIIYKEITNSGKYLVNDNHDVAEKLSYLQIKDCMGKECLIKIGKLLNSDFALSASYAGLGDRILVTMKIIDVKTGQISKNVIEQFENQAFEMNRITDVVIEKLLLGTTTESSASNLIFKDGPSATPGLGKLNNSGPRIGVSVPTGDILEFLGRNTNEGGLGSPQMPLIFNIGYQLEVQYVGSEKFSGLFEFIGNVGGLERTKPVPSLSILHGVRFGKRAWEIALGPTITLRKETNGTTDYNDKFYTLSQLNEMGVANPENFNYFIRLDDNGPTYVSSNFMVAFGRTFRTSGLNIPVNIYASMSKYGTVYGLSMGMNITKSRTRTQAR